MAKYRVQVQRQYRHVQPAGVHMFTPMSAVETAEKNMKGCETPQKLHWELTREAGRHGFSIMYIPNHNIISVNGKVAPALWFIKDPGGCGGDSIIVKEGVTPEDFEIEEVHG